MVTAFDIIAEQRIREAEQRGELRELPGSGHPLDLEEPPLVPPEMRMACRVLKNAGLIPPEIETRREMAAAEHETVVAADDASRRRALQKLALLQSRLEAQGRPMRIAPGYRDTLLARLEGPKPRRDQT